MRNRALVLLAVVGASIAVLCGAPAAAQAPPASSESEQPETKSARKRPPAIALMQEPVRVRVIPSLAAGTEVPLVLTRDVKVKKAQPGDTAEFILSRDLWYRDTLLARRGTPVQVLVQTAETAKWLSRGSKLGFEIQTLKLLNGSLVPLRGEADYRGGINSVSGAMFSANSPGGNTGAAVGGAAMVVGVFGLLAPGKNQDAKTGSRADAWVAEDVLLDMDSLRAAQPPRDPAAKTGEVRVLRGIWDRLKRRDLYCNGVPVAHLPANRKYVANLKPGWYRFSLNTKREPVEIFVVPGEVYTLVALPDAIRLVSPDLSSEAVAEYKFARGFVPRTPAQMFEDAKPVDRSDLYGDPGACTPLAEEFVPAAAPAGTAANSHE